MKRILGFAFAAAVLVAITSTFASAAVVNVTKQVSRAKYPAGACTPDSMAFILEGNSGSAPTCNDTSAAFYIGNHVLQAGNLAATTSVTPLFSFLVSGVPTGVATDSVGVFIDYAPSPNGPWVTKGQAVPSGWDSYLFLRAPTAASDSTGAGATKALYAAGSTVISPLSTQPCYRGFYGLTGVTIGSDATSPIGFDWARLRLTGDKTTGTINSLFDARLWVSYPVNVADPQTPADPR